MTRIARLGPGLTVAALLAALPVAAQKPDSLGRQEARAAGSSRVLPLEGLVVTVTRTGQALREVPAHVTVLDREVIDASASLTLPDLLRTVPGFTLRVFESSIAAHPTQQAPSMRGMGGGTAAARTLVLLDGIPAADPFAGWVHWARIPLHFLDRVEVVRGGGSGIWGSRAMGGVINLLTERPRANGARFSLAGGSNATYRVDGAATWRSGPLGISLMGEHFDTDGYVKVKEGLRTPIDEPAGTRHNTGFLKLDYDVAPNLGLQLDASYLHESRPGGTPLRRTGLDIGYVRGGARYAAGGGHEWNLNVFGSRQSYDSFFSTEAPDRSSEVPSLDQFDVPASSAGAGVQWSNTTLGRHSLTAGADLFWVDGEVNEDFFWTGAEFVRRRRVGGEQSQGGLYAQDMFTPAAGWHLLAGLRWDATRQQGGFRSERDLQNDVLLADTAYTDETQSAVSFTLGVRHDVSERVAWRASVYRSHRAPTLNELLKPFREPGNIITEANPQLRTERSIGAEAGLDLTPARGVLVRLTGFWANLSDPIVEATVEAAGTQGRAIAPCGFVPAGGVCRQRRNLETFRASGIEAEFAWTAGDHWLLSGTYLWNPTEVVSAPDNPELEGNVGSRTPEHAFTGVIRYADPAVLDVSLTGRSVGRRWDDDLNTLVLEDFFVLDARLARAVTRSAQLFFSVENLFDVEYVTSRSINGLTRVGSPRLLLGGISWRL